jgi:hypothetical protein
VLRSAPLLLLAGCAAAACTHTVEVRDGTRIDIYTVREGGDLQRGPIKGLVKVVTGPQGTRSGEEEFVLLPLHRLVSGEVRLRDRTVWEFDLGQGGDGWRRIRVVVDDRIKSYQAVLDLLKDSQAN